MCQLRAKQTKNNEEKKAIKCTSRSLALIVEEKDSEE